MNYARSQLVKYLTDKVIENVSKQVGRADAPAPTIDSLDATTQPDLADVIAALRNSVIELNKDIQTLDGQVQKNNARMTRLEKRWSIGALAKVYLYVTASFLSGGLLAYLLHWGGWFKAFGW